MKAFNSLVISSCGASERLRCRQLTSQPLLCAQVAVIGRSNVGKSSLLNLLTFGASGALVSAKPGTTQQINHYRVVGHFVTLTISMCVVHVHVPLCGWSQQKCARGGR